VKKTEDALTKLKRESANYELSKKLTAEGVDLGDVLDNVRKLEEKISVLEKELNEKKESSDVFAIYEQTVKDSPSVKTALSVLAQEEKSAIKRMLMQDDRYKRSLEAYRKAVNAAYVEHMRPKEVMNGG
jgi:tetratricopeptide (TPR) repeat protein